MIKSDRWACVSQPHAEHGTTHACYTVNFATVTRHVQHAQQHYLHAGMLLQLKDSTYGVRWQCKLNDARQERLVNLIAYTRFKPSLFNSDRRPEGTVATYAVLLSFSSTAEQFSLAQCSHASQTRKESATNAAIKPTTAALQPTKHRNARGTCTTGEAMQVRCATVSLPHAR